jgi:hypothetical protein
MRSLRAGGVDTMRAPEDALEDFIDSRAPKPEKPSRSKRRRYYDWLREKE